jgi:HCOMODA/2-hydroxy-3-carboxy-muconic semialdehyde decarboxylase
MASLADHADAVKRLHLVWSCIRYSVSVRSSAQLAHDDRTFSVPNSKDAFFYELSLANRIVSNEGIIDSFGHVSMRDPDDPNRYFLSRSRAPALIEPGDIIEYTLDSDPVRPPSATQYSERVIHGEIYKARPDVMAVCHHHSPAFMPLVTTGIDYVPVFHLGATGGAKPPFWDQRDEFGDTNMLVVKPEEGASLARALADHWMVLMWRHGVTVAGRNIRDTVFRSIYSARNADYQMQARAAGTIQPLTPGEIELCAKIATSTTGLERTWEHWVSRLAHSNQLPPYGGSRQAAPAKRSAATKSPKKTVKKAVKQTAKNIAKRKKR